MFTLLSPQPNQKSFCNAHYANCSNDKIRVENICIELNISLGNFTYYFTDKQQIIVELYLGMIAALEEIDKKINVSRETIIYLLEYHRQIFVIETDFRFFYLNTFEILNSKSCNQRGVSAARAEWEKTNEAIVEYIR